MFFKSDDGKPGRDVKRRSVPLLPLRDIIVFPHMVSQLFVGRERSINALDARSILDRSDDIAAALRQAMLSNHEINDNLSEL